MDISFGLELEGKSCVRLSLSWNHYVQNASLRYIYILVAIMWLLLKMLVAISSFYAAVNFYDRMLTTTQLILK